MVKIFRDMTAYSRFVIRHPALCVFFILFFPLLLEYLYSDFVRESELNARVGWFFVLLACAFLFRNKFISNTLLAIFMFSGVMDNLYAVTFGGVFTAASFEALALTDTLEALEFVPVYASVENLSLSAFYVVGSAYFMKQFQVPELASVRTKTVYALGLVMLLVAGYRIGVMGRYFDTIPGFMGALPGYFRGTLKVSEEIDIRKNLVSNSKYTAVLSQPDEHQVYLIVIGESLSRRHMGLYGYHRDTTPGLHSLGNNLFVFDDVISGSAQTQPSLRKALTQAGVDESLTNYDALSMLDLANMAGFKTWWISNQQPLRATVSAIAGMADVTQFLSSDFQGVEVRRFDGYLLPYLQSALEDESPKKAIFVHLMGSHLQYANRYPEDYSRFFGDDVKAYREMPSSKQLNMINAYDNSVIYTDHVIHEMITQLQASSRLRNDISSALVFSDHGEEVFDTRNFVGHGPDGWTVPMLEIPMLVWASEKYQTAWPEKIHAMNNNRSKPYVIDHVFHTAVDLMGIESTALENQYSLLSDQYKPRPRIVYGVNFDEMVLKNKTSTAAAVD